MTVKSSLTAKSALSMETKVASLSVETKIASEIRKVIAAGSLPDSVWTEFVLGGMSRMDLLREIIDLQNQQPDWIPSLTDFRYEISDLEIDISSEEMNWLGKSNKLAYLDMKFIPGGSVTMGMKEEWLNRSGDDETELAMYKSYGNKYGVFDLREAVVDDFYISNCVVSQTAWEAISLWSRTNTESPDILVSHPSLFNGRYKLGLGDKIGVENVSMTEAESFCSLLSEYSGLKFRLPTEAEWEYAYKADSKEIYYWGDTWGQGFRTIKGSTATSIHHAYIDLSFPALIESTGVNGFKLYGMAGNFQELCTGATPDSLIDLCLVKNGSWGSQIKLSCSAAHRHPIPCSHKDSTISFRVVCEIPKRNHE